MAIKRLAYKDSVVSTATKPINTKDLLTRLESLYKELSEYEQENTDIVSLELLKEDLVNKKLLKHNNKNVQILVACCIADVLRLYAPDAPYDDVTLNAVFKLFMDQFDNLDDQDSAYYQHYVYLLKRVAEVKLIALMTDLDNHNKLILQLFERFYSLSAMKEFDTDTLQPYMIEILSEVINEVNQLDIKILKLILNKFLANSKKLKNQSNIKVPGFEISLALCELNADKLSRLITYFFSEMILEATNKQTNHLNQSFSDSENSESEEEVSTVDIAQLTKIHALAVELWRYVPEILTAVLSLFDTELEADNEVIRMVATDTIGKILAIPTSRVNFSTSFISTYTNWLKKPLDISVQIRLTWIKGVSNILEARNDITTDIIKGVLKTIIDSNDKVRLATIMEFTKLKPLTFLENVTSDTLIETLLKLLREKHVSIRNAIIQFLATIFNFSAGNESYKESTLTKKIPNHILNLIYINDPLINSEIDTALFEKILPFDASPTSRVERFFFLVSLLDEKSSTSLNAILKRQSQFSKVLLHLLTVLEDELNFEKDEQTKRAIKWISNSLPETYEPETSLSEFFALNNKRMIRLLRLCVSETTDYDTIVSSMKEILNRVNDVKVTQNDSLKTLGPNSFYMTMKLLLLMSSNICYNIDNIGELIKFNNDTSNPYSEHARITLENISQQYPDVLTSNVKVICQKLNNMSISLTQRDLSNKSDLWQDLNIVYNIMTTKNSKLTLDSGFYNNLLAYATDGSVMEAEYAIKIINCASMDVKSLLFVKIVNDVWPLDLESTQFNTHLSALSNICLCDMISVDSIKEDMSRFLASEVLLKNQIMEGSTSNEGEESWISDEELYYNKANSLCLSKILTMKLLTNWLISIKDNDPEEVEDTSKPILSMLSSFINRGGEIVSTADTPVSFCSRLRLHAGIQMLELAEFPIYDGLIDQRRLNRLVLLIQDVEVDVREKFVIKLKTCLTQKTISKRFLSLIFMTAFEPNTKMKVKTSTWIRSAFNKQVIEGDDNLVFEKSYPRLIFMILNHPEFKELYQSFKSSETETESLKFFKELSAFAITYIAFYLSLIQTSDNVALLYYFSQRMKQFKPILLFENDGWLNDCYYLLSEISQPTIKYTAKSRGWNISLWPNKLNLPHDLFEKLDSANVDEVVQKSYISDEESNIASEVIRNKWRVEHNHNQTKKPKKKADNKTVLEYARDFDNVQNKRDLLAKKRSKKLAKENDREYHAIPSENQSNDVTRKSKRAKRVNYMED